jgi:NitT/TauT family transport system substrate-binding protein
MLRPWLIFLSLLLGAGFAHDAGAGAAVLKKATFLPQWSPQAQFAGYYVAYEKGFYRKRGIDLTILQGGPNQPPNLFLEQGKADFVTIWLSTAIQRRSEGFRLVNIGQIIQRSALMLVAKKASNIKTPEDMNGKKVGLWGGDFQLQPTAFFEKYKLRVTVVPQSFSVNLFLRDGVDVASAMWYNEYHVILNAGVNPEELNTFFFDDYGLNFPEDGIYALEETYKRDPALCCAFVEASLEGWRYAFSHPDEALDIVLNYISRAKIPANRVHQRWMLERMKDIVLPRDKNAELGLLQQGDYQHVSRELAKHGAVKNIPAYESFFVGCRQ